jgi:hypothetical protein
MKTASKDSDFTIQFSELPEFVQSQFEIINSLQNRVHQINKDFEIEMNCKNQVYHFIISKGYLNEYIEFNKQNPIKKV